MNPTPAVLELLILLAVADACEPPCSAKRVVRPPVLIEFAWRRTLTLVAMLEY